MAHYDGIYHSTKGHQSLLRPLLAVSHLPHNTTPYIAPVCHFLIAMPAPQMQSQPHKYVKVHSACPCLFSPASSDSTEVLLRPHLHIETEELAAVLLRPHLHIEIAQLLRPGVHTAKAAGGMGGPLPA